jgi:glycosyltransferase involved in cell wall biosynthesis
MLSLLIPTYNYNVLPLVLELQSQSEDCKIEYEIIVIDDGSNTIFLENQQINTFENCKYIVNEVNLGRASNINKLVELSKFEYILILEADAFPSQKNYIQSYVKAIRLHPQAVFGGVIYSSKKPIQGNLLRWIYGNSRESKSLEHRIKDPLDIVFSWNLLLKKSVFLNLLFDSSITTYGFEDLVFLKKLKKNQIKIVQIENILIHQNEEQSTVFIDKSKTAVLNLIELYQNNVLVAADSNLLHAFETVKNLHLLSFSTFLFTRYEKYLVKNLLSEKPSLFLFDLYRLGYFCQQIQLKIEKG